jgi:hypothetical protein
MGKQVERRLARALVNASIKFLKVSDIDQRFRRSEGQARSITAPPSATASRQCSRPNAGKHRAHIPTILDGY